MSQRNPFHRNRPYPKAPAPNDDVSAVRGNCSVEHKQLNLNTLAFFGGNGETSVFGFDAAKHLKLVEMNLNKRALSSDSNGGKIEVFEGHTVCEIEVKKGMLNRHGVLAGACLVHVVDIATFTALYTIGFATGADPTGASTDMNIRWHAAALPGTVLSILSTTLNFKGRTLSCRAEVYDKTTGTMIASAVHTVSPLASFKDTATRKAKL
ncbi:hypothetical protein BC835DRAFT_158477 [Cytidiella melzeri]|nr:hypothetical protein BC835DRAFT_158477 [Cytidiella melzeri]